MLSQVFANKTVLKTQSYSSIHLVPCRINFSDHVLLFFDRRDKLIITIGELPREEWYRKARLQARDGRETRPLGEGEVKIHLQVCSIYPIELSRLSMVYTEHFTRVTYDPVGIQPLRILPPQDFILQHLIPPLI